MSTIKIKGPKCPRSPITVSLLHSAIQKKGVLGHFASFGPFSLLVDIKRQCPVVGYTHDRRRLCG